MAGEILKKNREKLGVDVREIADYLKIRKDFILAMESDSFQSLPVPVYTKGYIRGYCEFLKIDPSPILEQYEAFLEETKASHQRTPPPPESPGFRFLYLIPVLLIVFAAIYYYFGIEKTSDSPPAPAVQSTPSGMDQGSPAEMPVSEPVTPREPPEKPLAVEDQDQTDAPDRPVGVGAAEEVAVEEHTVVVDATEKTWVSITLVNGEVSEALLQPGESKTWSFQGSAVLRIGNAGGISLSVDGKELGPPGGRGEVMTLQMPGDAGI